MASAEFVIEVRILSADREIPTANVRVALLFTRNGNCENASAQLSETGAHMERMAEIGASVVIKGDVTAHEDIVISGRVEGTVSVENFSVTVRPGANLKADIEARTVIVGGHVSGTLSAAECIELQRTAQVEGEIVAAVLRLDDGAVFNGKAQTTKAKGASKLQLAS
jgi:cytoskeletal protein CcmA (bactofilin family)